ncbi:hypothetical protein IW262DRAFT_1394924 [Armillaria fumosa]|nr:hypothetical protein IW262DRAFT_1394924 [Armillaria fumosa]
MYSYPQMFVLTPMLYPNFSTMRLLIYRSIFVIRRLSSRRPVSRSHSTCVSSFFSLTLIIKTIIFAPTYPAVRTNSLT